LVTSLAYHEDTKFVQERFVFFVSLRVFVIKVIA